MIRLDISSNFLITQRSRRQGKWPRIGPLAFPRWGTGGHDPSKDMD